MGMYYSIITDIDLDEGPGLDDEIWNLKRFPGQLSYFFEQIGGYGHCSEVAQVSKILDLDLSLFQTYDFYENPESENMWQSIDDVINKLIEFDAAIKANPHYYKSVKHRPAGASREEDWGNVDKLFENFQNVLSGEQIEKTIRSDDWDDLEVKEKYCPQDDGYLSSGRLQKDIQAFIQNLDKLKNLGTKKIKLHYG